MKYFLLVTSLLLAQTGLFAQNEYWVFLVDKGPETQCLLSQPEQFLSQDAIDRKAEQGIAIGYTDLPVYSEYLNQLKKHTASPIKSSRWMNAAIVSIQDTDVNAVLSMNCVQGIQPVRQLVRTNDSSTEDVEEYESLLPEPGSPFEYGRARHQNDMLTVEGLHMRGITGRGVRIAVFDAGFSGADTIDVFDSLHAEKRILAAYDFVENDPHVYHAAAHGTQVLSTIAANAPGKMVGTAPHVSVVLARTEDARSETRQEEHNWVRAMEWADSIGVDIIHSSLGYSTFDTEAESYQYEQMDGNSTIITKAADLAAKRGIIVTVSAGNEGVKPWKYITAPCDGDSVLCIGSVDKYQKHSIFSSVGPTADGRTKPDVVAMGSRTTVANPNNRISSSNGTSFSGPLVAGLVACLRQAHPDRSHMDIIQALRLSGDQFSFPDDKYGFGIPNAELADSLLANYKDLSAVKIEMTEKPLRGKQKPVETGSEVLVIRATPAFTENPQSEMSQTSKLIRLNTTTSAAQIKDVRIMKGMVRVTLDPKSVKLHRSGTAVKIKTKYLSKDEYYIHLITDKYEEYLPFTISE